MIPGKERRTFSTRDISETLNDIEDLYVRQAALRAFKRVFSTLYWATDERGRVVVDE